MPKVSLVICVYQEAHLLDRLLESADGCYDELLIIQDGADESSVGEVARKHRARFLQEPRRFNQELHWPRAWSEAAFNWILRLDADEIPSMKLKDWLQEFRTAPEPDLALSGYSCIWPLWDGSRVVTTQWPAGRLFLFEKNRVRFFAMPEQTPTPDLSVQPLPLVLEHRPARKSYGLHNLLVRKQAHLWRSQIAHALLGAPTDLPTWRWHSTEWPSVWEDIRKRPLKTALKRLVGWPIRTAVQIHRAEGRIILSAVLTSGLNHCLIALGFWRLKRKATKA
jgi:hypothetical protein